ncbi:MAG TPA: type II toxin-antitoxin system VapC family toxin [Bryobacteraceae bacterium]
MIILDTNVLSEALKPVPEPIVIGWLERQGNEGLYTTSITESELLFGVALLPPGKRRSGLLSDIERYLAGFTLRMRPFDSSAARMFPVVALERRAAGRAVQHFDTQIAAIARSLGATVATRDIPDFEHCGIGLINPWDV